MNADELGGQYAERFRREYTTTGDGEGISMTIVKEGLSLRQYYAGLAMQGSLGGVPGSHLVPNNLAREAVAYADALLAELAKESA